MGDIASANDKPDKGLASLGTIIVEPGSISDPINLDNHYLLEGIYHSAKEYMT